MSSNRDTPETIDRWLAAEAAHHDEEAERLLGELFAGLPDEIPSAWFAQRVMAALPPRLAAAPAGLAWRWLRPAVLVSLLAAGLSAALGPGIAVGLFGSVRPSAVIGLAVSAIVGFCRWMAGGLALWDWLGGVSAPLVRTAGTPPIAVALALTALTATLAFVSLSELMQWERSTYHAHDH